LNRFPVRLSRAHAKENAQKKANLVLFAHPRSKDERQRDNIAIDQVNSQWASVDPKNTKVFVGGISQRARLQDVASRFAVFGTITNVGVSSEPVPFADSRLKINFGKGCAFVSYARKIEASTAIDKLNGEIIDGKRLRVTWSRSSGMSENLPSRGLAKYS
jgi:RNA recognition motif-containing protein